MQYALKWSRLYRHYCLHHMHQLHWWLSILPVRRDPEQPPEHRHHCPVHPALPCVDLHTSISALHCTSLITYIEPTHMHITTVITTLRYDDKLTLRWHYQPAALSPQHNSYVYMQRMTNFVNGKYSGCPRFLHHIWSSYNLDLWTTKSN